MKYNSSYNPLTSQQYTIPQHNAGQQDVSQVQQNDLRHVVVPIVQSSLINVAKDQLQHLENSLMYDKKIILSCQNTIESTQKRIEMCLKEQSELQDMIEVLEHHVKAKKSLY